MLTNKLLAAVGIAGALVLGVAGSAEARGWGGGGGHRGPVFQRGPVYGSPVYRPVYQTPGYAPVYTAPMYRGVDWRRLEWERLEWRRLHGHRW